MSYAYPDTDLSGEPSLDELFGDPIVHLIMQRDGVEEQEMRSTLDKVRRAYQSILKTQ